ncbi:hypothetical protein [Cellvibrio sp. NN19]|uniref:hypothetical protein n=1 Tax=Cellvibrio chitinivorans TaxID=3102792 RepID=UPI002B4055DD|nr:hypothetical protein [Cellvibrio sp. NN19]
MKNIFKLLPLLLITQTCLAWECLDGYDRYKDPIETHISKATEIIFGTLVSGNFEKRNGLINFEMSILKSFKGKLSGNVSLKTNRDAYFGDLILGGNYIIFLYGSKEIDFCGVVVKLEPYYNRVDRLNKIWDGNLNNIHNLFENLKGKS